MMNGAAAGWTAVLIAGSVLLQLARQLTGAMSRHVFADRVGRRMRVRSDT